MKTITVLSGKGGVGKSSLTASLSVLLARENRIVAADCDVDASNLALVLGAGKPEKAEEIATNYKAYISESKCISCEKCIDVCTFSAISRKGENGRPEINGFLCEGCGACKLVCPQNAISLKKVKNGVISAARTKYGFPLVSGQLKMGESGSGKVVDAVKERAARLDADMMIVDSAAGIGCPVIASVRGSDYVIAVTEPSPAALSDLKRALDVVEHFGVKYGIVINKHDLSHSFTAEIEKLAKDKDVKILGKLPYDKAFVEALVGMTPVIEHKKELEPLFREILENANLV